MYHNDGNEQPYFTYFYDFTSLQHLTNVRGNFPQNFTDFRPLASMSSSALNMSNVANWNSIHTVDDIYIPVAFGFYNFQIDFTDHLGSFSQDFMQNNPSLKSIDLSYLSDTSFKLSRLKSDWNTYFKNLYRIVIHEDNWNREDLSALMNLHYVIISPDIKSLTSQEIDNIIIQVAAGAGQSGHTGLIVISGSVNRTATSDAAVIFLKSKGWTVITANIMQ